MRPHPVLSAGSAFGSARRATRHVFAADALGNDAFTLINGDLILRSGDQLYRIAVDGTSAQRE